MRNAIISFTKAFGVCLLTYAHVYLQSNVEMLLSTYSSNCLILSIKPEKWC